MYSCICMPFCPKCHLRAVVLDLCGPSLQQFKRCCMNDIFKHSTCSSPNLSSAAMGSDPGERMKMRGAQQLLSPNAFPRLNGGTSIN